MASTTTLVLACGISALIGGLASGAIAHFTSGQMSAEPAAKRKGESRAASSGSVEALVERIDDLEGKLSTLRRQQQARQRLTALAENLAASDEPGEDGERKPQGAVDSENPKFELAVRSVMDRVEWEKDEERKVVSAKRRDDRARRQTSLLTERLGLDSAQADAVATALMRQMEEFRAMRGRGDGADANRPATRSEWRERIADIRKKTEDALKDVLTDEQMQQYRAVAEEEGIGARGWGPRGRNRGGTAQQGSAQQGSQQGTPAQ